MIIDYLFPVGITYISTSSLLAKKTNKSQPSGTILLLYSCKVGLAVTLSQAYFQVSQPPGLQIYYNTYSN